MRRMTMQTVAPTIAALTLAALIAGPASAASVDDDPAIQDVPKAHSQGMEPPSESADTLTDRASHERMTPPGTVPRLNLTGRSPAEDGTDSMDGESDPIPEAHRVDGNYPSESVN